MPAENREEALPKDVWSSLVQILQLLRSHKRAEEKNEYEDEGTGVYEMIRASIEGL